MVTFKRQEQKALKRLKKGWRRPRGKHSKLRKGEKARGPKPSPGYSSPRATRGLNRAGLREVVVHRPNDLDSLSKEAVVIAHAVGKMKKQAILKKADEKKLLVLNR